MRNILNDIQNRSNDYRKKLIKQSDKEIEEKRVRYEWLTHIKTSGLVMTNEMEENLKIAESEYKNARNILTEKKIFDDKVKARKEGEMATSYFINLEKNRSCQRHIPRLRGDDNVYTKSQDEVNELIVEFYENLYSNKDDKLKFNTPEEFIGREVNHKKITIQQRESIDRDLTINELD